MLCRCSGRGGSTTAPRRARRRRAAAWASRRASSPGRRRPPPARRPGVRTTATGRHRGSAPRRRPVPARRSRSRPGCRAPPCGAPRSYPRVLDVPCRPRDRPEPLGRNRLAADLTEAVRAVVDALQGRVDLGEGLLRALLEPLVELAVERHRRHVAEMVVGAPPADLAELVLHARRVV